MIFLSGKHKYKKLALQFLPSFIENLLLIPLPSKKSKKKKEKLWDEDSVTWAYPFKTWLVLI